MPNEGLTARQQQIYDFIGKYSKENKYSPTFQEIAEHCWITRGAVFNHLGALEKKKKITRISNDRRGIKLLGAK